MDNNLKKTAKLTNDRMNLGLLLAAVATIRIVLSNVVEDVKMLRQIGLGLQAPRTTPPILLHKPGGISSKTRT